MSHHRKSMSDVKLLNEKIKGVRIAMLTTVESDNTLRSRPMVTQDTDFDGDLWFFTQASAPKVEEVRQHQEVNLSYVKPKENLFISVSGTAELVSDQKKVKERWEPFYKAWFPNGENDPDLALLKVTVTRAEYWNMQSKNVLSSIFKSQAASSPELAGVDVKLNIRR